MQMATAKTRVVKRKSQIIEDFDKPVSPPRAKSFHNVADEIAQSGFFYRNYPVPALRAAYPNTPRMFHVERCYSNAKPVLFVDFVPQLSDKLAQQTVLNIYLERSIVMRNAGLRYVYITHDMSLGDALEQMGEV
jgi:hypothetical protein